MSTLVARPVSTGLGRVPLPTIPHPSTKLGEPRQLTVRGESRGSSRPSLGGRAYSDITFHKEALHPTLGENLPPLTRGCESARAALQDFTNKPTYSDSPWSHSVDLKGKRELRSVIQQKLATGYHGIQHLFKANDPTGQGQITREALQRILFSLLGYISPQQFNRFLNSVGLDSVPYITFSRFLSCFQEDQNIKKEWLSPAQQASFILSTTSTKYQPEAHIKWRKSLNQGPQVTASQCHAVLKAKVTSGMVNMRKLLPPLCLEPGGFLMPQQLREVVGLLGLKLSDAEFKKLWQKYDKGGTLAIRPALLFNQLGVDEQGRPFEPKNIVKKQPSDNRNVPDEIENRRGVIREQGSPDKKVNFQRKPTPKLDSILDCLHYKFEEGFYSLLQGCKCFDFLEDGFISRIDLNKVFAEFGLNVPVTEVEYFLKRNGVRVIRGSVAYKEFLAKFWNKSENGLVNRIATDDFHIFGSSQHPDPKVQLDWEQLEAKLIEFMHKDFLSLLGSLRKCDKYSIGVVPAHEFRKCVEQVLGYSMSNKQWKELKEVLPMESDGLIAYPAFLDTFSAVPGKWNRQQKGPVVVPKVRLDTPPEVQHLRQLNAAWMQEMKEKEASQMTDQAKTEKVNRDRGYQGKTNEVQGRSLQQLTQAINELFRLRFHSLDKAFKQIDRKMTGRLNKPQFAELLRQCSLDLQPTELEHLWSSLELDADGMISFRSIVKRFASHIFSRSSPVPPGPLSDGEKAQLQELKRSQSRRAATPGLSLVKNNSPAKPDPEEKQRLLMKVQPDVIKHWERLKALLRELDPSGFTTVSHGDFKNIAQELDLNLTPAETEDLLSSFTTKNGYFKYMEWLEFYKENYQKAAMEEGLVPPHENAYKLQLKQPSTASTWCDTPHPTVAQVICRLRHKLLKDWKSLRRAFKRMDSNNTGYLSIPDFKHTLEVCKIKATDEDIYQILAEFDSNLDGRISYDEFLAQIINV